MADKPWKGRILTPGQIAQRLQSIGCTKSFDEDLPALPDAQAWKTSTGKLFWISLDECDDEYFESIVEQIKEWLQERK